MALTTASLRMQLMSGGIIFDHVYGQIMDMSATAVTVSISTQPYAMKRFIFCHTRYSVYVVSAVIFFYIHRVSKNLTPIIFWHNFTKTSQLWIILSREDCESIAY